MTLNDARKILGLGPDEDPVPHLAEFRNARERIAMMVRAAPNETLADRYQLGLIEFDQALAAIQEYLGNNRSLPAPPRTVVMGVVPAAPRIAPAEIAQEETAPGKTPARWHSYVAWFLVLLTAVAGGLWIYLEHQESQRGQRLVRIAFLERQGSIMIENRRWQDAANAFAEIEQLSPGSELAGRGRRSIEAGMGEEQTQFIAYWTGQAEAELEAGRLDEAVAAARQVLAKYPAEKDAAALLDRIAAARAGQSRAAEIATARTALNQRKWNDAISAARKILAVTADQADANSILKEATAALKKSAADQEKAAALFNLAAARDAGQFDQQALDWLREASSLDPENKDIAARLEKLSGYIRTLRVPDDFATPAEALENARDRDRVVLGPGTWQGPLVIDAAIELQGAGFDETQVECPPEDGSAITIGPRANGARASGITFRHAVFAAGSDRFSAALVRGGSAAFVDCRFTDASGHGLAVIEGGQVTVSRSRFSGNGWNGVAAIGQGSTLEVRDCESLDNFEHGIETWQGAAAILVRNRCEGNSRNGIHVDNGAAAATIEGNQLIANREFGLVLGSAASGNVSGNVARANLLGGIVIRAAAGKLPVTANEITLNEGPGLVLEKGLPPAAYAANPTSRNRGQQILAESILAEVPPPVNTEKIPRASIVTEPP